MNALLLIDLCNDFCPGGMVEVPEGNRVIPIANQLMDVFELTISVRDWHPADHVSFAANHLWRKPGQVIEAAGVEQLLWPMHCVQHSFGAELAIRLQIDKISRHFFKGADPDIDSYSAFFDNARQNHTGLSTFLHQNGVTDVYILGLPTEYGVRYTALDALALGFNTWIFEDGCLPHDADPQTQRTILRELQDQGARLISSQKLLFSP